MPQKLSFFQRLEKRRYLSKPKAKIIYATMPDYLKDDPDIIDAFIASCAEQIIERNPSLIRIYIDRYGINTKYINSNNFNYLTHDEQITYVSDYIKKYIDKFGDIKEIPKEVILGAYKKMERLTIPFDKLSEDIQTELVKIDNRFFNELSDNVKEKFINGNKLLFIKFHNQLSNDSEDFEDLWSKYKYSIKHEKKSITEKISTDKYLLSKLGEEKLQYYKVAIANEASDSLKGLINEAYTDDIKQIFIDRPELSDIKYIRTFAIFNPKIVEYFGIYNIHQFLSADNFEGLDVLDNLITDDKMFEKFKQFSILMEDYYQDTPEEINKKLLSFERFYSLFINVEDLDKISPEIKDNMLLAIHDIEYLNLDFLNKETFKNISDLADYKKIRDSKLDEYIEKVSDVKEVREVLLKKIFSMSLQKVYHLDGFYSSAFHLLETLGLKDIDNKSEMIEKLNLGNDMIDTVNLIKFLNEIENIEILKNLNQELSKSEQIVKPLDLYYLSKQVIRYHSEELTNSLLTPEKAKEMYEQGVEGISYEEKDGLKIIKLTGANFILCTQVTSLGLGTSVTMDNVSFWNKFENGSNTISTSIYTPYNVNFLFKEGDYMIGFSDISAEEVVGMGEDDIGTSHDIRSVEIEFRDQREPPISFDSPINLSIENHKRGEYAKRAYEVALRRRHVNKSKFENGTGGGKIQPSYIVLPFGSTNYGYAKPWGVDTIIEVDPEAYKDVYQRMEDYGYKKPEVRPTEKSEYLQNIERMVEDEQLQGKTR